MTGSIPLLDLTSRWVKLMRYIAAGYVAQCGPGRRHPDTIYLDLPGGSRQQDITDKANTLIAQGMAGIGPDLYLRLTKEGNKYLAIMGFVCRQCAADNHHKCGGYTACDCQHRPGMKGKS
jgi:hypothetical protein